MRLLDIECERFESRDFDYKCCITMLSSEYKNICDDFNKTATEIQIQCNTNSVVFSCDGDDYTANITIHHNDQASDCEFLLKHKQYVYITCNENINKFYSAKYLNKFIKAITINKLVMISLHDQSPLLIQYNIDNNGFLKYFLAPIQIH